MIRLFLSLATVAAPLHFDHLPLGSAARVLSARYHAQITILANATAPISGDFSQLTIDQALALAAKQAGLVVRPDGVGFVIGPQLPVPTPPALDRWSVAQPSGRQQGPAHRLTPPAPDGSAPSAGAASPAEQRAALLRRRAELLEQAAKLPAP